MIDPEIAAALTAFAKMADEQGQLTPEQLAIIYGEKWFKLFVPLAQNGLELSLPHALRIEEALAAIDGSLGWTVTLCSGAMLFTGYLAPALTNEIFKDPAACFGGSGALTGAAEETGDGYLLNGAWKYATGTPHCTHFTANCILQKNGKPVLNEQGEAVYRSFLLTRSEVSIHKDWNTMGLKATASDSFSVTNRWVPQERSFRIHPQAATLPGPIYQYPFLQFAETTLAVNSLGMALHFLALFQALVEERKAAQASPGQKWQQANRRLQELKTRFYTTVEDSWTYIAAQKEIPEAVLGQLSKQSRQLTWCSRKLVTNLYPHCGVRATQNGTTLNRIFRDLFTASQHLLLNA